MSNLRFRLAAIDLDDTLLGPRKEVSEENFAAVRRLIEAGMHVVLASGRHVADMTEFQDILSLTDPLVACNGALVKEMTHGDIWLEHTLTAELAHEIFAEGDRIGITQNFFHPNGGRYVREENRWTSLYDVRTHGHSVAAGDLSELRGDLPLKILWIDVASRIDLLYETMRARYGSNLNIVTTDPEYLEFMDPAVNKANGVAVVARHLDIDVSHVITFGDGNNDVEMLRWAGFSVAMDHGRESAKAAARAIAPSGTPESSLARAIQAFVF